jgi:CheY-like chemotaxis protein
MSLRNILHVEDDDNDIFLLQYAFEHVGIADPVHIVRDGQEAIEYLSGHGRFANRKAFPLPALIIMDLKMPRKSGLDALRWLGKQPTLRNVPVLMLSSSAQPEDITRAYEAGANAFVVKPSTNAERTRLATAIKHFWLDFNEPPPKCTEKRPIRRAQVESVQWK